MVKAIRPSHKVLTDPKGELEGSFQIVSSAGRLLCCPSGILWVEPLKNFVSQPIRSNW
jgi:hypothetical protein